MINKQYIDVRVDYLKNGDFFPIAFIDFNGETNYIKSISQIENRVKTLKKIEKSFLCNTATKEVKLIFENNKWYMEE